MKMRPIIFFITLLVFTGSYGQQKWTLQQCVEYALKNNISVRQADVQSKIVALTYEQSKLSQYFTANIQNSGGYQFGRSIDPATNLFTNEAIVFANHSLNVGLDIFNWFTKKNTVAANRLQAEAYVAGVEKAKNDVALNVANAYLQVLLNNEQINVSALQVELSREQADNIRKRVDAGALPELNLAEAEAQLANDSSNLITAQANYTLSVLLLKSILTIPADQPFDVSIPPVDMIPVLSLAELDPAAVYALAEKNMPQQKINDLNLQSAIRNVAAARGRLFPSLTFFGGLDSRYSNAEKLFAQNYVNTYLPIGTVTVSGVPYTVTTLEQRPIATSYGKNTYFRQLGNNFSQSVGLGLNIPIFNGGMARINWKKAKLNVTSIEIQKEGDALTLKQDIYQAHANAMAAVQKFNAAKKSVETTEKAYNFAKKRFDVGLLNTIDLFTNQNNLFRARITMLSAQYDYIFKMKLLEFYRGQGLQL